MGLGLERWNLGNEKIVGGSLSQDRGTVLLVGLISRYGGKLGGVVGLCQAIRL